MKPTEQSSAIPDLAQKVSAIHYANIPALAWLQLETVSGPIENHDFALYRVSGGGVDDREKHRRAIVNVESVFCCAR